MPNTELNENAGIDLNPFAFTPAFASQIAGLGGNEPTDDNSYAFHTAYVSCATGTVRFSLRFEGLSASIGNLTVRVNSLSTSPGARAKSVKMMSKPLSSVAESGVFDIEIKAKAGTIYAVLGNIYGPTDAHANSLTVNLDRPDDGRSFHESLEKARQTVFGTDSFRSSPQLFSHGTATIANPVSQMCTVAQFNEPTYHEILAMMKVGHHFHRKQWEFVYIVQTLKKYGMLKHGSRGLGFGVGEESLPALFASLGCSITATDLPADDSRAQDWSSTGQHVTERDALRRPNLCDDAEFEKLVEFRPVDMNRIPADLTGFDFCWSACAYEHLGSIENGLRFVTSSLDCLNIGGIAVHTTELNLSSNNETVDNAGTVLFRRKDIERLALELIASGHDVVQINYDQGDGELDSYVDMPPYRHDNHLKLALSQFVTTSFGLIIRKGSPVQ